MTVVAGLVFILLAYSAWRLRRRIERYFSFYARSLFALAGALFVSSQLFPDHAAWAAARITMFCFACGQYTAYFLLFPYWSYFLLSLLALLPLAILCSAGRSNALNFLGLRFIAAGSVLSPPGVALVLIACVEFSLVGIVVLLNSYIVSPLFVTVMVVSLLLLFSCLRKTNWKNDVLRDAAFLAAPVLLFGFLNLPLPRHPAFVAAPLAVLFVVLIVWRTSASRLKRFLEIACVLLIANSAASLSPGAESLVPWRNQWTLEEIETHPGVKLISKPAEHYSCLPSPDGRAVFATLSAEGEISRIPLGGGKTITRGTEGWPLWTAYVSPGNRLAVLNSEAFGKNPDLLIFDANTLEKIRSFRVDRTLHGLHYSERLGLLYVQTLYGRPQILALNPDTLGTVRKRNLTFDMNFLYRMKGDDELDRLYLPDVAYNGTLHVLRMSTLEAIGRVRLGTALTDIAIDPERDRLYVACPLVSKIIVLRRSDLKKVAEMKAGQRVRAVAADPARNLVYAGNSRDATLDVYDAESGRKVLSIPAASEVRSIVMDPGGDALYLSSELGVFRVDLQGLPGGFGRR
ncbi:MAG: hypothetical protein ABIH66_08920 [bacterium]